MRMAVPEAPLLKEKRPCEQKVNLGEITPFPKSKDKT